MEELSTFLSSLESSAGANWNPVKTIQVGEREREIRTLSGVRYNHHKDGYKGGDDNNEDEDDDGDSYMQSLDITFPNEHINRPQQQLPLPVLVFVHGGGWSRGGKDNRFYGAPSICENIAASGCITIAPGYRLGKYPEFLHDVADAIRWVRANLDNLGGDPSRVYLGGHSAGGHIVSLLMLRHADFMTGIPKDFFSTGADGRGGLILLSGVYDLFSPLKKSWLDAKNKTFVLAYVLPAFGSDETLRYQASPLLLLNPEKETSVLGKLSLAMKKRLEIWSDPSRSGEEESLFGKLPISMKEKLELWRDRSHSEEGEELKAEKTPVFFAKLPKSLKEKLQLWSDLSQSEEGEEDDEVVQESCTTTHHQKTLFTAEKDDGNDKSDEHRSQSLAHVPEETNDAAAAVASIEINLACLPRTLVCNAFLDMGLEENGKFMADSLSKHTPVEYHIIPHSNHASICWDKTTFSTMRQFMGLSEE